MSLQMTTSTACCCALLLTTWTAHAQSEPDGSASDESEAIGSGDEAPLPVSSTRRGLRIAAHVTLGLGVAAFGASLGVLIHGSLLHEEWETENDFLVADATSPTPELTEEESRARFAANEALNDDLQTLYAVTWVLAASVWTLVTTAVVLYVVGYARPSGPWRTRARQLALRSLRASPTVECH